MKQPPGEGRHEMEQEVLKWIYDVVDNMEYTVGLFPAITPENGEYSINFGQTNMMFNSFQIG